MRENVKSTIIASVNPDSTEAIVILNLKLYFSASNTYLQTNVIITQVKVAEINGDINL